MCMMMIRNNLIPVIDGGGVGLRLVEQVSAEGLVGGVAAGVEDAPPHVVAWGLGVGGRRRHRRGWRLRHRHGPLVHAAATLRFCVETKRWNANMREIERERCSNGGRPGRPLTFKGLVETFLSMPRPLSGGGPARTWSERDGFGRCEKSGAPSKSRT
ncbi:hypothetical protein BHM03_00012146 [Ensete ventricosum]|nr:hypothetical protein BHM03_00012146 [Ensete ventricosum]